MTSHQEVHWWVSLHGGSGILHDYAGPLVFNKKSGEAELQRHGRVFRVIEAQLKESHSTTELKYPYKNSHKDHVENEYMHTSENNRI